MLHAFGRRELFKTERRQDAQLHEKLGWQVSGGVLYRYAARGEVVGAESGGVFGLRPGGALRDALLHQ